MATQIYYKDDFKIIFVRKDSEGNVMAPPSHDWKAVLYTEFGYSQQKFEASQIGGVLHNAKVRGKEIVISVDNPAFSPGKLFIEWVERIPDADFPDGERLVRREYDTGCVLTTEPTDITTAEVEMQLPYIYQSAYDLAVVNGYEGSMEDYMRLSAELPEAVETAKRVSESADSLAESATTLENSATSIDANTNALTSLVSDWADGKAKIAEALTRKYLPTEATESFDAMANKVMSLKLAAEGQEGIIDHTANGIIDGYDLLNELHKNQRQDYPYCCGIEFASGRHTQVVLSGAEAYLCSDGFFTTKQEVEHTFNEDYKLSHYVIYYYTYPTYQVPTAINPAMKLIAYNGQPRFILSNYYCPVVRSYTNERYSVGSAEVSINYNGHIADIMLSGIEDFGGTVYGGANNTALTTLSLPHVISSTGSISTANTLFSVSLPKLTTINGGNLFTQVNSLRSLSLPSLEVVNGGGITHATSALTSLSVPKLKIFKGAWLAYGNSKLTDISFPNLEDCQASSGLLQYFPPEIHFPKLKRCKNIVSQGNRIGGAGIVDVYLPVVEDTCTHGSITAADVYMIFHLGKQQDKTISWTGESRTRVSAFTVENGFRSNLNISPYTHLDVSVIEAIIDNLADNNDYEPLTLTLGATLKNKLSEEYIAIATAKNYNIA